MIQVLAVENDYIMSTSALVTRKLPCIAACSVLKVVLQRTTHRGVLEGSLPELPELPATSTTILPDKAPSPMSLVCYKRFDILSTADIAPLDTGIRTSHSDFGGRAVWGFNSVSGTSNTDNNGHGT
jgi:hypothetical protein